MNSGNDCLSVTLEKTNSSVYFNLENIWKNSSKKIVIAELEINLTFWLILLKIISESKSDHSFPDSQLLIEGFW